MRRNGKSNAYNSIDRRCFLRAAVSNAALLTLVRHTSADDALSRRPIGHFTLWQLPDQVGYVWMSYVLRTRDGKVIVVDGGMAGDAPYLKGFLGALGNHVHAWFITHPHMDHIGALNVILNDPGKLKIEKIYASLNTEQWTAQHEPDYMGPLVEFNKTMARLSRRHDELRAGQVLWIDEIRFEILGVKNPEITVPPSPVNNSSVVMRVTDKSKSVLFTGDIGVEGSEKILAGPYRNWLKADYVQMAHHGQAGATEAFYKAVAPKYCLWPTPLWLWDCDIGLKPVEYGGTGKKAGKGSGPWKTLEVRAWMDKLNIKKHYIGKDGLSRID